ncbi:sodium-dependent transporter [Vallitalea pronyensis]|uniref:Transporter n=1 Tax=Vallitalea pronyensis TaxID=1348613 RepID=A0A8J8SHB6_9FIRM|nr:sodium-dependent transporter [Vallitalea pronyensis]QUI23264.1 sodium-dependent transporter [Vallitalea pronyensis]
MAKREQWGSRVGFILAAIGSAVGLGNIWRFPYTVAKNGGGAFLIPYLVALFTAGIPLLILEFGLGHKMRTSAPGIFGRLNKRWQKLGWWQTAIAFVITVYYVAIIGWALSYVIFSLDLSWGIDTADFFKHAYLKRTASPFDFDGIRLGGLIPLIIVWGINYIVLAFGIKGGIEKANKIFMPILFASIIIITIRGLTLPGAFNGLDYLFKPDFSKILEGRVWVAAYGQIFYSLSICFGIMLAYSSYLPKKSDIVNNAFITAFGNCSFSIIAGIAVFSILGNMALSSGKTVEAVAEGGIGLAFIVFPEAINGLPNFRELFGALFFLCLFFAGLSSSMSIIEATVSAVIDKFNMHRLKALSIICGVGFVVSVVFVTGAGVYVLDIVDHFVNNYGVAIAGLIEALLIGWFFNVRSIRNYVNPLSDFGVGNWWELCIKLVTPLILGIMVVLKVIDDIKQPYEGYPIAALLVYGVGVIVLTVVLGLILSSVKGSKTYELALDEGVKNNEF